MENRQTLHTLVDELPEPKLPAARRYLEYLRQTAEPLRRALEAAPVDDEPLTDEERAAIRKGREEHDRGETASHDEMKRLLREAE
jgi:hypothetical protein